MKRVLYIGCNAGTESMPGHFKAICDYHECILNDGTKQELLDLINSGYSPDIVFLQIQSDKIDKHDTCSFIGDEIRTFKDRGSTVVNWTGDKRNGVPRWMIDFHKNVTITAFSNEQDMAEAKKYGMKTMFIQQGVDTNIFTNIGDTGDYPSILFLANNYGNQFPLSSFRRDVVSKLQSHFGNRFGVYGNGWNQPRGNLNTNQYEESKAYRSADIAISVSNFNSKRYFSDRLGRALCSGVFVISHDYEGIEIDFEVGKHLDVFKNITELVSKIEYWLQNMDQRKQIANQGMEHAIELLSYKTICNQICAL